MKGLKPLTLLNDKASKEELMHYLRHKPEKCTMLTQAKMIPSERIANLKNHTLYHVTYLYSQYMGVFHDPQCNAHT